MPESQFAPNPPPTRRDDVVEILHGESVVDPYRWLEDGSNPDVTAWSETQTAHARAVLDGLPGRSWLAARTAGLFNQLELVVAELAGDRLFSFVREADADRVAVRVRDGMHGDDRMLIDPARLDGDHAAIDWWYPSRDGSLIAYGVSTGGDEWSELRVRNVDTGEDLIDRIPRARSSSVVWVPEGNAFYYTRYLSPADADEVNVRWTYFHVLGDDWRNDPLVFGQGRPSSETAWASLDPSGRWYVVNAFEGFGLSEVLVLDREHCEHGFADVTPAPGTFSETVGVHDDMLYLLTSWNAPNYQIIRRSLVDPAARWETVIPERTNTVLETARLTASHIVTQESERAVGIWRWYDLGGTAVRTVDLPEAGTVSGLFTDPETERCLLAFESFLRPMAILGMETVDDVVHTLIAPEGDIGFDPTDFVVNQEVARSADGTEISLFVVHRKGLQRTGDLSTVIHGYGGLRFPMGSSYTQSVIPWIEQGGVFVVPNLRGGGEYGADWHRDGQLERKQNVFDDAIAVAEHLISAGYTNPSRLGCSGSSNGGILVGALVTQRPDLFRAAWCGVPLMDMLRYHLTGLGITWISEFGSADRPDDFSWLYAYSPYHRVVDGVEYPAMLLTAAENDTRVDPLHARKMTARLQAATTSDVAEKPILLSLERDVGHAGGKPTDVRVAGQVDRWSFLAWQLGLEWPAD